MSTVRELIPKKGEKRRRDVTRSAWPFGRGMEDVFEGLFRAPWAEPLGFRRPLMREFEAPFEAGLPAVDLIDREGELVLRAELPGVKKYVKPTYRTYKVKLGDNLSRIAVKHHTTVAKIKRANNLRSDFIREGQILKIPY